MIHHSVLKFKVDFDDKSILSTIICQYHKSNNIKEFANHLIKAERNNFGMASDITVYLDKLRERFRYSTFSIAQVRYFSIRGLPFSTYALRGRGVSKI